MTPEQFVEALYEICLGRRADADGKAHWVALIRATGDPTKVLQGILDSEEYRKHSGGSANDCTAEITRALAAVKRPIRIVDVGAQSLGAGTHPYDGLLKICDPEIIGFDPLAQRLLERAESEPSSRLTLLPYAVGDGGTYTFYVNNEDANSSFFPLDELHNARFNHISQLRTVQTTQMTTRRLDEVLPEGPVDFLKLDTQGAELMILKGAERTLSQTATVHCEVMFSAMYVGEPLFPAVQEHLLSKNFELIDLLVSVRYSYLTPSGRSAPDRLLWADAVFFRKTDDPETQRIQALIAAAVYQKPTLAEHLLVLSEGVEEEPCGSMRLRS